MVAFSYDEYITKICEETRSFVNKMIDYLFDTDFTKSNSASDPVYQLICAIED